jgi:HEPN domain-containing protein
MGNRHLDWFRQAEADLKHAMNSMEVGDYEWSCFSAQQASEKAVKSVYIKMGMEAWGHTVSVLLGSLKPRLKVPSSILESAKGLDKHYIPTRYPNGFDDGAPVDFYTKKEATAAVRQAKQIVEYCRHQIN